VTPVPFRSWNTPTRATTRTSRKPCLTSSAHLRPPAWPPKTTNSSTRSWRYVSTWEGFWRLRQDIGCSIEFCISKRMRVFCCCSCCCFFLSFFLVSNSYMLFVLFIPIFSRKWRTREAKAAVASTNSCSKTIGTPTMLRAPPARSGASCWKKPKCSSSSTTAAWCAEMICSLM